MYNSKLFSLVIVTALAIVLVACGKKTTEESIFSANQYMQNGNPEAAIVELKNAINSAPENGALRLQLGTAYFQVGELTAAEKEFLKAKDRGISNVDVVPLLQQVYYYSDQFDSAVNLLEKSSLVKPDALSTAVLFQYLSSLRIKTEQEPLVLDELKPSLSDKDWAVAKAFKLFDDKNYDQAKVQLQRLIAMQHRPIETEYLKALSSYFMSDYATSIESFKRVKELMPNLNSINFQLVETMIKAGQLDEADKEADKLLKFNSDNPLINFYKGNIAYSRKDFENALLYTEKAIQKGLNNATARMIAGVSAFQLKSHEKAYLHLKSLSQRKNFHSDAINRMLARVQLSLGYNVEASDSLQSLEQLDTSDAELFSYTAAKLAMSGDFGSAKELLSEAGELDSDNTSVKLRQAEVNFGRDEEEAIRLLQEVIKDDKDLDVGWMQLAMAHVRNGDKAAALDVAKQWSEIDKANGKALEGVIYLRFKELEDSLVAFKEALSINPRHPGANQYLLKIYDDLGQTENIIATAKDILAFSPNNLQSLIAVVNAANKLDQSSAIEAYLSNLIDGGGDTRGPLAAIALSKRLNGDPEEAIRLLGNVDDLDSLGYITLGDAYLQIGDNRAALESYERWSEKSPDSLFPVLRVIAVHEMNESIENALNITEKSLVKFPSNNTLKMLQLHYATKLNQTIKANDLIEKLKSENRRENSATLPYYEGQLALNAMKYEKAEELLSIAHNASPNYISAAMLAKAMIGNGHIDRAKVMLEKQLNNGEEVPERFKNIVASFYTHIKEYGKAAAMYQNLISKHGEDAALLNNFAYNTLMANGDLEVAKVAAQKAVELAPDNAGILDTLAWIEFKSGDSGKAYIHISKAADMNPASNQINLHFAELLISIGNVRKAKEILDKVKRPSVVESKTLMQLRKSL